MIAPMRTNSLDQQREYLHQRFLAILPTIQRQSATALCKLAPEVREELTEEIVANTYCAFIGLVRRGKEACAYPTTLAEFALRQLRSGRRVGSRQNTNDVLSQRCRQVHRITIERLEWPDEHSGNWSQLLVEDRRAGPAETAIARIDVATWFGSLSVRHRQIARALSQGESTAAVARKFNLSPGRISQLRSALRASWERFQGKTQSDPAV